MAKNKFNLLNKVGGKKPISIQSNRGLNRKFMKDQ